MTKDLPPSRTAEQFVVRFPEGMRDRIAEAAKKNNRSMNAEIVARLEQSFSAATDSDSQHALEIARVALQKIDDRLAVLERQIGRDKVGPKKPEQISHD